MTPKYLLKITEWPARPWSGAEDVEPLITWHTCMDEAEADCCIQNTTRPGFGSPVTRVVCEKFLIGVVPRGSVEIQPITMLERAKEYHTVDGQVRVNVKLYGQYHDGPSIYWDSNGNSFAIVKPTSEQEGDRRYVSEQGVLLLSVNGIGEVRWSVSRSDAKFNENKEAVDHFGLTWTE